MKDFRLMFSKGKGSAFLKGLLSALFLACFAAIEIFLFSAILQKIRNFSNAPRSFMLLFLIIISAMMTVSAVFQAQKLFFNEQDIQQLINHPVANSKIILSKMILLVGTQYATSMMFVYPLFVAYGSMFHQPLMFYYTALFYPLAISLFEIGIALLLVYPVWMLLEYLKKHVLLEFCLSVSLLFALVLPYAKVLNTFVDLVANNELTVLFSEESMAAIAKFGRYAFPYNLLADFFLLKRVTAIFPYIAIVGGVFMLGLTITIFTFHKVRNLATQAKPSNKVFVYKMHSQTYGLIKKELILLTKNPDYIFSFSGLLLVQPFLLYLVVSAMNAIFESGTFRYYTFLFPNFVALVDVFLIIMVALIINSGANQYISIEERTIKTLKTVPIDYKKQLLIKMLIPYSLSSVFALISILVLLIGKVIYPITAIFSALLTLIVVLVFDIISLREELHIRHGKPRSSFLSSFFSYLMPFAYIALMMFLSFNGYSLVLMYSLGALLFILIGLPLAWNIWRHMKDWFMDLEAIN